MNLSFIDIKMFLLILVGLGLLGASYLFFCRESFFAELAISFLPYFFVGLVVFAIILLIVLLCEIWVRKGKKNLPYPSFKRRVILISIFFFWSGVLGYLYGSEFFSFYGTKQINEGQGQGVKVYYANILYTNYDYESLRQQVENYNPDVVVLVEFSDEHDEAMKAYFQENFPYVNRNSWSTRLAGDIVFSKYPISNLLDNYPQEAGKWRYSYFRLEAPSPIYFYVVHTSAPVSEYNFNMRQEQLKKLNNDFWVHDQDRSEDASLLMIGDFNLSPWSAFYSPFESAFDGQFRNAFRGNSPVYTRSLWDQNVFVSHIDHLFVSPNVSVSALEVGDLP